MRRTHLMAAFGAATAVTIGGWILGSGGAAGPDSTEVLVVDDDGTVSLVDTSDGSTRFRVDDAVVSRDRSSPFRTVDGVGSTHIESRDAANGDVTGLTTVAGDLAIRAVSPRAGAIALMEERADGLALYEPIPRDVTSITVAYTDERPSQEFSLPGNYEVETFSYDESVLYLLEFQPPTDPEYYLVRELNLATGEVEGVKTPQVELRPEMRGVARSQQVAPDGRRLFTLYSIPSGDEPVHDVTTSVDSERWAFVHVLDLEQGIDFCIFLPTPMGEAAEASVGLGLSPDGSTLWVVDPSTSLVARIDTTDLAITEVYEVPELENRRQRAEVTAADDGTVYIALGPDIIELAPDTLALSGVWRSSGAGGLPVPVNALSISADSQVLFYGSEGRIVMISRATREELAVLEGPDGEDLTILGPPTGAAVQIPLSCAC